MNHFCENAIDRRTKTTIILELIEVQSFEVRIQPHDGKTNYKTITVTISDIDDLIVCVYNKSI